MADWYECTIRWTALTDQAQVMGFQMESDSRWDDQFVGRIDRLITLYNPVGCFDDFVRQKRPSYPIAYAHLCGNRAVSLKRKRKIS
jgi:hypothetical protein